MRALPSADRNQLSKAVLAARKASKGACRAAIDGLGVFADKRPEHLNSDQAALRNGLRAKWRQLDGDRELLIGECAYEQWHRLLFARFLAENNLLLHPQYDAPVTLADCEELATDLGEPDAWSVAARFASEILPGIFRLGDPCVRLRLAPEGRHALEQILDGLPTQLLLADDALGWVYQYWQKDKKDEVNASERKIGGADIGPVTQLFTENYMVRFLLENSLGAWWAARHPESPLAKSFEYLRFDDHGKPAAGSFDGWPGWVAEVTVMDPCCGSGHFLVEAFSMLWQMRAEEEGLSPIEAQDAVLRENLFGLELDSRCVQIAMFAVVLQAWKAGDGWRQIPIPNIACSGVSTKSLAKEWRNAATEDLNTEQELLLLRRLFNESEILGSLIDPRMVSRIDQTGSHESFEDFEWTVLEKFGSTEEADPASRALGVVIGNLTRVTRYLTRSYTLTATNVPFLGIGKMVEPLADFVQERFPRGKHDLATVFIDRALNMCSLGGTAAVVSPQNWLHMPRYEGYRNDKLRLATFDMVARLGARAFEVMSGWDVNISLFIISTAVPYRHSSIAYVDASEGIGRSKGEILRSNPINSVAQADQLANPDSRMTFADPSPSTRLSHFAESRYGLRSGDSRRFIRKFWELQARSSDWVPHLGTTSATLPYSGRENWLLWEEGHGALAKYAELGIASLQGGDAWGREGIVVSLMGDLPCYLYKGEKFDNNCAVVWPKTSANLPALWAFLSSAEFNEEVRVIDQSLKVMNATLLKVPFDAERWTSIAETADPLPQPWSDNPTQWLFEGQPELSTAPLQVGVGRLLGYRWPNQVELDKLDTYTDNDGIVCIPPVAGESRAVDRVQELLAATFGESWSPAKLKELLDKSPSKKKTLADWLRDDFFKQHCVLFGNRPFIWHIWDGLKDGFSALVNYHLLDHKTLAKLTYSYIGQDWVERQRAEVRDEVAGAEARLTAALELKRKLELILDGEQPYDIYVRWNDKADQAMGWEPDLNDGVRLNIRPFVTAGVLRYNPNIHWRKDRGKNPDESERLNDIHLTLAEKADARKQVGRT